MQFKCTSTTPGNSVYCVPLKKFYLVQFKVVFTNTVYKVETVLVKDIKTVPFQVDSFG